MNTDDYIKGIDKRIAELSTGFKEFKKEVRDELKNLNTFHIKVAAYWACSVTAVGIALTFVGIALKYFKLF